MGGKKVIPLLERRCKQFHPITGEKSDLNYFKGSFSVRPLYNTYIALTIAVLLLVLRTCYFPGFGFVTGLILYKSYPLEVFTVALKYCIFFSLWSSNLYAQSLFSISTNDHCYLTQAPVIIIFCIISTSRLLYFQEKNFND